MLTLQQFITKYTGVKCGNTNENFGQCVGLISLWQDNLGASHEYGNAKDLLNNADQTKFNVIYNSPFNAPKPGDILVFNSSWGGGYGHTGIVTSASVWSFSLFEQNNPLNAAPHVLAHSTSDYFSVLGWLHPKVLDLSKEQQMLAIINTSITDTQFRQQTRAIYNV